MSEEKLEIQPADTTARRRAAILVIVLAIIGAAAIVATESLVRDIAELSGDELRQATERLGLTLKLLTVALASGLALIATWMVRLALHAHRAGRFPPPGQKVARRSRVLHGAHARRRALLLVGVAVALVLAGLVVCVLAWRLVESLGAV